MADFPVSRPIHARTRIIRVGGVTAWPHPRRPEKRHKRRPNRKHRFCPPPRRRLCCATLCPASLGINSIGQGILPHDSTWHRWLGRVQPSTWPTSLSLGRRASSHSSTTSCVTQAQKYAQFSKSLAQLGCHPSQMRASVLPLQTLEHGHWLILFSGISAHRLVTNIDWIIRPVDPAAIFFVSKHGGRIIGRLVLD